MAKVAKVLPWKMSRLKFDRRDNVDFPFQHFQRLKIFKHAAALEGLKDHLRPGARVLDVGSGSGYLTACFAKMVSHSIILGCPMEHWI